MEENCAPQEEIDRDMICGVMQMNRGTKTITLHSNQPSSRSMADAKKKNPKFYCTY